MSKVILISGSTRDGSVNTKLANNVKNELVNQSVDAEFIDLKNYDLPIYNGDIEAKEGVPDNAKKLYDAIKNADGFVIASPEYNGLPSPLLINTISWLSRISPNVFEGKKSAIISASPGGLGGLRSLNHLRALLNNLGTHVIPKQHAIGGAFDAFDNDRNLKDDNHNKAILAIAKSLIEIL